MTERQGRWRKNLLDNHKERKDTGNWKKKHWIALCGVPTLEELWTFRKTENKMNVLHSWRRNSGIFLFS